MKEKNTYGTYTLLLAIVLIGLLVTGCRPTITRDVVVGKIRNAKTLTTTKYRVKVATRITKEASTVLGFKWPNDFARMITAQGMVRAGINWNEIKLSDVSVSEDGKNITVTLPPVVIIEPEKSLNINEEIKIYYGNDGIFADPDTEVFMLFPEANRAIVKTACRAGIMETATEDARIAMEKFLNSVWPNVTVTVLSGEIPPCPVE